MVISPGVRFNPNVLVHSPGQRDAGGGPFTLSTPTSNPTPVPEPASLLFLGTGLVGLAARYRRSKTRSRRTSS